MDPLVKFFHEHQDRMLDDLRAFVEWETPSTEKELLDGFSRFLADYAVSAAGGRAEIVPAAGSGDHVLIRWGEEDGGPPLMLLGHYDTVWPAGTLEVMPFGVEGGVAAGPGVFDMKCGLVQGFWAVRALHEVLGVGRYRIRVAGRPSHAGLDPEGGISAIEEMARLILELHGHTNPETGTTVNVGVASGGTRYNVIAAEASAEVDVRTVARAEADRMDKVISDLQTHHPEAKVDVQGGMIWPPMERTEKIAELFDHARRLAADIGFELKEGLAGGASDGCLCADLGVPVLDGLGAVGGGAHATDEHVEVASIPLRAALVASLMETL